MQSGKYLLLVIIACTVYNLPAQVEFFLHPTFEVFHSGIVTACADVNGDFTDDLLVLDKSKYLHIGYNNGRGAFLWRKIDKLSSSLAAAVCVADIDNNGYNDIFVGNVLEQSWLLYQYKTGFAKRALPHGEFICQGAAFFDVNADGWIDLTACDDENVNKLFLNDGSGNLMIDDHLIDFKVSADPDKNGGNYSCLWSDYDMDGDPELYISKCFSLASSPSDIRRINTFYKKEGNVWKNRAAELGIALGDQSWTAAMEDLNGDQLMDLIVVNHYSPSVIFLQKPDHSFEILPEEISNFRYDGFGFQVQCADFDNDADMDIWVAGSHSELFLNDGNAVFEKASGLPSDISSFCLADFDNNGFIDIYASRTQDLFYYSFYDDRLLLQNRNDNNYVVFCLQGDVSNKNGIGTKMYIHAGGKIQVRELRSGQSFGIQNSLNVHVGLGKTNTIDSIEVWWPSGSRNAYYRVSANNKYLMVEGGCLRPIYQAFDGNEGISCADKIDTVINSAGAFSQIEWNDGSVLSTRNISEEGIYFFRAIDSADCPIISNSILVRKAGTRILPLHFDGEVLLCNGESAALKTKYVVDWQWSDGTVGSEKYVSSNGKFSAFKYSAPCDTIQTNEVCIRMLDSVVVPTVIVDSINPGDKARCVSLSGKVLWYDSDTSSVPIFEGSIFETPNLEKTTCYYSEAISRNRNKSWRGGAVDISFSDSMYHKQSENNQLLFEVKEDVILDSFSVYTTVEGIRTFQIGNHSFSNYCNKGWTRVAVNYLCKKEESPFVLTTNASTNLRNFGTVSPQLARSNRDVTYPYWVGEHLMIRNSNKGDSLYYYFFDWKVRMPDKICSSPRVKVCVPVRTVSSDNPEEGAPQILFDGHALTVNSVDLPIRSIDIFNTASVKVFGITNAGMRHVVETSTWPKGLYFVIVRQDNRTFKKKMLLH